MATLLLTRPLAQSQAFAETCRVAGFVGPIEISPILDILPVALSEYPAPGDKLVFTSVNGVRQAAAQFDLRGFDGFAVGDKTAEVACEYGMTCRSAEGDLRDLVALLLDVRPAGLLWQLRGTHSAGDLAALVNARGLNARAAVVYDQVPLVLSDGARTLLHRDERLILPLFSPRSAAFLAQEAASATAAISPVAISAAAAAAWTGPGRPVVVERPDGASMLRGIIAAA